MTYPGDEVPGVLEAEAVLRADLRSDVHNENLILSQQLLHNVQHSTGAKTGKNSTIPNDSTRQGRKSTW